MIHDLKVHSQFYEALTIGAKRFDLRRNDRNYKVGDKMTFRRYDPAGIGYTGQHHCRYVTYVLYPEDCPGLMPGFVILGLGEFEI